jgi:prefoldin alpha subunit
LTSRIKSEEELRKLSVELRFLEQTADALQSRMGMVNAAITDLTYASMTLEGIEKEKENSELLLPVGGNSYIKARLETPDKVIVGMGAGVSMEKTLTEAKTILKGRLDSLQKTRLSLEKQFAQVAEKINEDRNLLNSLLAEIRQGTPSKNV